ncbi:MAG TPA: DUF3592 domain-containing protein, partial [Terriglobales bacterium]|nr:DUF3592 domain-containing protein [Terriglobales bacterium]
DLSSAMNSLRYLPYALLGSAAFGASIGYWLYSRRKTPEQVEQERRTRINSTGRITDGTVIDAQEMQNGAKPTQFLIYQYDVGGVGYEASQDVTYLRQFVDLHSCRIGLPASVKYDPANPGNSIVISEEWSGLRKR